MIAGLFRAICQVVGIDPYAVTADQARDEVEEIPLGAGRGQHVPGVDAELMEDGRELVHESDIEIALRILDHLCRFGDLDRRCSAERSTDETGTTPLFDQA